MRRNLHDLILAVAILPLCCSTSTAVSLIFEDTFDSETLGLGLSGSTALSNWNVTAGNIDLIGPGLFDFFPGNGRYVDLGGTSSNGAIQTKSLLSLTPGLYQLSFEIASAPGFNQNVLDFSVGTLLVDSVAPTSFSAFTPVMRNFTVLSATSTAISFAETGPLIDDGGTILDDVRLVLVPEPSALTMATLSVIGLGVYRRCS